MMRKFSTFLKARANESLNKMEHPAESLDYFYQRQLEDLLSRKKIVEQQEETCKRVEEDLARLTQKRDAAIAETAIKFADFRATRYSEWRTD